VNNPLSIQVSTKEWEAVKLAWNSDKPIPEHEAVRLLVEIRARKIDLEAEFASLATRGIAEGRRTPRRHQVVALAIGVVVFSVLCALLAASSR
jgi:hypothetical protein